jgi:hypothetical protein
MIDLIESQNVWNILIGTELAKHCFEVRWTEGMNVR